MNTLITTIQWLWAVAALFAAGALLVGATSGANDQEVGVKIRPVFAEKLANAPGMTLAIVTVNYAPAGKSGEHHHAGCLRIYAAFQARSDRELRDRTCSRSARP